MVEQELDDTLANAPSDFAALLQALPSIDPIVVVGALRRRAEHGSARAAALLASASADGGPAPISPRPIAHPLEYDWRFTAETVAELAGRLDRATGADQTIGYLGAPAAFALAAQKLPGREHVLLDRSARFASRDLKRPCQTPTARCLPGGRGAARDGARHPRHAVTDGRRGRVRRAR